jgi:signal transduction histidine kinase
MPPESHKFDDPLAALTADPIALPWPQRVELAREAGTQVGPSQRVTGAAGALLRLLASDQKWEVRKAVADALHALPDNEFNALAAQLTDDANAFVKGSAERALERRRRGQNTEVKRRRGLDKIEDDLARLEKAHGAKVARLAEDMARRLHEGSVGAAVHEIRSVVTAMDSSIDQLLRGSPESLVQRLSGRLRTQVRYIERLLDDMRLYTQVPSRERHTERISDLVAEATTMVRDEFAARGRDISPIQFSVDVPNELTASVSRVQIVLAFRNLLKNAFEAHAVDAEHFQTGEVRLTARSVRGGSIEVEIADTGTGFSPEELEEARRFVPGRTSKHFLGTGFGLPIARRNITAHGGTVQIESVENEGTRVIVNLPIDGKEDTLW